MMPSLRSDHKCVVVILRPRVTLALTEEPVGAQLALEDQTYRDTGHGDFTGFYDWLRSNSGQVLGVRYWPLQEGHLPREMLARLSYVALGRGDPSVEIYFSQDRSFDPEASGDQDFGDNRILRSGEGEYAVTFGAHWLSDADLQTLRTAGPDWVQIV